jgi:uncharacterized protein (DUF1330 family)
MCGDGNVIVVLNLLDIIPGEEGRYAEYLRRVQPILDRVGAKILLYGRTRMLYMGNATQEYCGLIAYKNLADFRKFSNDPQFKAILPLRDSSTTNYVMSVIEDFPTMGDAADFLESLHENRDK